MKRAAFELCGTNSGSGKTTVTCAVIRALSDRGMDVTAFKCGPDYIDPMFHSRMLGARSRNLDIFMCGRDGVKRLFARNAGEISVIEGVMGMYDGMSMSSQEGSSTDIALLLGVPQILVVNARGMALSAAAVVKGFCDLEENNIAGVILNGCTAGTFSALKGVIEERTGKRVFGYLPRMEEAEIGSRHLGLITAEEIADIDMRLAALGNKAAETIDIDGLLSLATSFADVCEDEHEHTEALARVAVARDRAFSFIYEDNIDIMKMCGLEPVFFSPLSDEKLPEGVSGLVLYGGYPEVFAKELSANTAMRESIKRAVQGGMPTIAECGGFMYLMDSFQGLPMAGAIPGGSHMTEKLVRFGYIKLTANKDTLLTEKGGVIRAHEFHYSDCDFPGDAFTAEKRGKTYPAIYAEGDLFAGYPHIHFGGQEQLCESFAKACIDFGGKNETF